MHYSSLSVVAVFVIINIFAQTAGAAKTHGDDGKLIFASVVSEIKAAAPAVLEIKNPFSDLQTRGSYTRRAVPK